MIKQLLAIVFFVSAALFCGAQSPLYRIMQHAGNADRYYSICFDSNKMLWAGGRPNGLRLNRTDANLEIKGILGLNAEPGIEYYISEIGWDAGNRLVGCGNYQDGNFGKGFIVRFDPLAFPNELLFLKKIEGDSVRLSGLVQSPADSTLWVYGTSRAGGIQRGELFKFDRSTGALRSGFPKRYSVSQGLSFDAAILHAGRLYTAGACSLGDNATTFGLACLDATSGEPLWCSSNPAPAGQTMHLEARDLIFTNDDGDALVVVGSGDDQHSPVQGSHIFLQKSRLDGSLLWIKKIDLPDWTGEFAEEVVAVSDGYLIYGHSRNPAEAGVFLLKTDKNGQTKWARKISRGTATTLPDWPAQSQMLVGNEAVYLTCNAAVTTSFGPRVALIVKLPLDGAFANCPNVQPTLAINLPFDNLSSIGLGLSATASPLQATTITAPVQTNSPQALGWGAYCTQTGYICNDRPDLTARVGSLICLPAGAYAASISVCNLGKTAPDTGSYLTFFDKNPLVGSAAALQSVFLAEKPQPGSCLQATVPLDAALLKHPNIFTLVGAGANVPTPVSLSGFPFTSGFAECEYANNIDSFVVKKPDCNGGIDCADTKTFLRKLGSRLDVDLVFSMCKTADGNFYLAGRKNPIDHFITKMTPGGDVIWMRKIPAGTNGSNSRIAEIIEDSEGKIVFCTTQGITPNTRTVFAMRYDPVGDTLIWFKYFGTTRPTAVGIVEKEPGGNFLVTAYAQVISTGRIYAQIFELGRNTGETVPGAITSRYEGSSLVRFERMVARQNSLYATGARQQNNGVPTRSILAKLSASTGNVEWVQATTPDSTSSAQPDVLHTDLEFDGDFALMVGSGLRDAAHPAQGIFAYLEKHAPDGSLLWLKRYEASIYPEDVLVLPNAYVIIGKMADNRWALLKTDKDGNPLIFKTLNTSTAPLSNTLLANRQGLILDAGDRLFMADYGPMMDDSSAIWLLKTSHDLELDAVCGLLQPASVQATTMPAKSALVPLTRTPFTFGTADAGVIYEKDSLQICGLCPVCPCCAPDLTARVDSIGCSSFDAIVANISVCNSGETSPDTGFYLTFYDKNPLVGSAAVLQSVFLAEKPKPGSCLQATVPLDAALLKHPNIFTLVGAGANVPTPVSLNGFPFAGGFAECGYANNLDSFQILLTPDCTPNPDSCHPNTYLKIIGEQGGYENASALRAAPDGNLYMAGRKGAGGVIYKTAPDGKLLWAHSFLVPGPQLGISISEIIVDSEGMIVGAGRIVGNQLVSDKSLVFRFNPLTFQMLWTRQIDSNRATEGGILEKTPGGNYLLYQNPNPMPVGTAQKAEILELDRITGQIVPAFANRYQHFQNQTLQSMVAHGGALYATGYADTVISGLGVRRRILLTKLDASTGQVIWSRIGPKEWTEKAYYIGGDLIVDGNHLLTFYHGNETENSISVSGTQKTAPMFLQKTTLDGELLWVRKYMTTAFPREVVAVPDGYVLFGGYGDRHLLKTDKEGKLLVSKLMKSTQYAIIHDNDAENQIEHIGSSLFIASNTTGGNEFGHYTSLLKTGLNLDMEFPCGLLLNQVQDSAVVNPVNIEVQQAATPSPALQQDLTLTLAPDEMVIRENCPVCSDSACPDRPDLTAHVDSITCSFFDGTLAYVKVCNLGKVAPIAGFNLTFYDKNPLTGGAAVLQSVFLEEKPDSGACVQVGVQLGLTLFQYPKIYTLVGAGPSEVPPITLGSFPLPGGFAECGYANNLDSFVTVLPPIQKLNLGPDRKICTGQTVTLDAGSGYVLYNWSAGPNTQTYTTDATGRFAVEVIDACGRKQRDTVQVTVFPYPKRTVNITLLPGDSVVIGGKTYKGTTTFVDTIPSLSGPCDTVTTYHIRLDSLHCTGKADAFIQANYQENENFIGRVVLPASDGSIYTGGESHFLDWQFVLTKTAANGKVLWSRGFDFANSTQNAAIIDHLIEDSEGKLVGTFTQLGAAGGKVHFTAFRYDPQSDQLLWVKNVRTPEAVSTPRILAETKTGGNFVVAYSLASMPQGSFSEVCELDRATGNPVGNSALRYGPGVTFYGGTVHKGILYANGLVRDTSTSSIATKNGYVKIDLSTGQPIDQKILKTVSGSGVVGQAAVVGQDEHLVSLLFSADTAIWLRKTTLNGDVLWLKRYKIKGLPLAYVNTVGISAVSDGYVFALEFFDANSQYIGSGLHKADLGGNIVWAKQFDALGVFWGRSPQIVEARGDHIYLTGVMDAPIQAPAKTTGALVAKLDKDGNAGPDCGFFKNISVSASDQTNTYEPAVVNVTMVGRSSENVPSGPRSNYDLDIYTRCSRCFDPCAITLALPSYLSLCPGDTIMLQAPEDFDQFNWQDGSTDRSLVVTQPGLYHVMVKDKCGAEQRDSVTVGWATPPVVQKIVVLLPGESISIAGKTYSAPAKFEVIIPSNTGVCDTTVQYDIVISPSGCAQPSAFFKSFGGPQSRVIVADRNNGAYLLGESQGATTLVRFDSTGQLLWSGEIIKNLGGFGNYTRPVSLIQDSDGMLTGCGTHSNNGQIVVFRYDPTAHQMIWLKMVQLDTIFTTSTPHDILEEKPGGHFLLLAEHSESNMGTPFFKSEIMRLDRVTGDIIGPAKRYGFTRFREAVVHGSALYISGTLQNPSVANDHSGGLLKIDLTTDQVLWAKRMTLLWPSSYGGEDLLIDTDGNIVSLLTRINEFVLQKNSPDGSLIWQRKYATPSLVPGGVSGYSIRLLQDGSYAVALTGNLISGSSILIAKIAKDGPVKWAKFIKGLWLYISPGTQWLDVRENTIYFTNGATEPYTTLFGKFDASGDISGACQLVDDVQVNYASSFIGQIPATSPVESRTKTLFAPSTPAPVVLDYKARFRCIQCESICDTIRVTKTISFYPGDTITIDGNAYTQSGTVVQNLTTPAGCDSIVTNILQRILTELSISCPTDLTVILPPNEIKTVVDYALPTATTDCPDPTITLRLLQGSPVGGSFSQGKTLVCYEAANECGIRDTCCFSITALPPDPACDVKTPPGCVRYELLGIRLDAQGQRRYRVRITNLCASPLEFAYIQLPNGVLAVAPVQGATYTAPGGNDYKVRNPNASPFYSIRYQAVAGNLNNGKSNIFEYALPQQAQPAYIRASARLADGSYSETHLNTYYCPEIIENLEFRMENFPRSSSSAPFSILHPPLLVRPNPTSGVLFVDLVHWRFDSKSNLQSERPVHLRVLNAQGQLVLERDCVIEAEEMRLDLPFGLASGLYYLVAQPEGGERVAARFVVER